MTIALAQKSLSLLDEIFTGEMEFDKLMTASIFGGSAVANSNVGICHPLSYGLSLVLGLHHGYSICIAFNQLEEYYPEVLKFRTYLKKNEVELPQNITKDVSQGQMQRMVEATLKNEIPLANAFGENWREVFSPSKVEELFLKM
jgi:3-deoxy-alpha-D-manno-octulosonate 8-oxidase